MPEGSLSITSVFSIKALHSFLHLGTARQHISTLRGAILNSDIYMACEKQSTENCEKDTFTIQELKQESRE